MKHYEVEDEDRRYRWDGKQWFDIRTYSVPPGVTISRLNEQLQTLLAPEDEEIRDPQALLERAKVARDAGQLARAERLVLRVLERSPDFVGALAIYTSLLRRRGSADLALEVSHQHKNRPYSPLIVSRAAALCDLHRWEDAKEELARALAMGGDPEAFAVMRRIKAARPDLYPG